MRGPGGGAPIAGLIYDYRNQMVRYVSYDTVQVHVYHYDAFGRRITKIVDATGANDETRYFYGGKNFDHVIEEQTDTGSVLATYVYGEDVDEIISMQRDADANGSAEDYYFHCDDLYNVMAATDATGAAAEAYSYSDYGDPTVAVSTIGNPYRFTGRRFDEESGLYWYRSRYYDPVAGRFTSRDTIGLWGGAPASTHRFCWRASF